MGIIKKYGKTAFRRLHFLHYLHYGGQNGGESAESANSARIIFTIRNKS